MCVLLRIGVLYLLHFFLRTIATINPAAQENCLTLQYGSNTYSQKGCECVVYQSMGRSRGKFTSPNFPRTYPRNINCILYTFIADIGEIVELTFLQFEMMPRNKKGCTDYLRVFLNLDRPVVNQYTGWNYDLCGNLTTISKRHYSSGRTIILELHSDPQPANYSGFMGNFRFLDERQYRTDCTHEDGTTCTYSCRSTNHTKTGKFFSPRYPQPYPPGASCQYVFRGRVGERISVVFQNMQLYHTGSSCKDSPDVITVHDGSDKSAPVIGRFCGVHNQIELTSSREFMYIDFYTDNKNQQQGFAASFSFCTNCLGTPSISQTNTVNGNTDEKGRTTDVLPKSAPYNPNVSYHCDTQNILSSDSKNGTFSSLNYPRPYPGGVTCSYNFQGEGRERVRIQFTHLDLYYPSGNPEQPHLCSGSDSVTVFIDINGRTTELKKYCGKKLPQVIMSNQPSLTVMFSSIDSPVRATGFQAQYTFVENFGITTGKQDSKYVCGFNYFSSTSRTGVFMSPNHPGYYPRNTECHYLFYGKRDEKVYITFTEFEVDGVLPRCQADTHSDYVEFSNFNTPDRKFRRYCGNAIERLPNRVVWSDMEFFRIMFKSNDIYDGKGFYAKYEFKKDRADFLSKPATDEGQYTYRTAPNNVAPHSSASSSTALTISLFVLVATAVL